MPITFKSKYSPDVLMLETVARELIRLMGHSGALPGSLAAEDIGAALARLAAAVEGGPARALQADHATAQDDDHREPAISATHRAGPLIKMLQTAARKNEHVIWDR